MQQRLPHSDPCSTPTHQRREIGSFSMDRERGRVWNDGGMAFNDGGSGMRRGAMFVHDVIQTPPVDRRMQGGGERGMYGSGERGRYGGEERGMFGGDDRGRYGGEERGIYGGGGERGMYGGRDDMGRYGGGGERGMYGGGGERGIYGRDDMGRYGGGERGMGPAVCVCRDPLQTPQMERGMYGGGGERGMHHTGDRGIQAGGERGTHLSPPYQPRSISADRVGRDSWRRGDGLVGREVIEIGEDEESDVIEIGRGVDRDVIEIGGDGGEKRERGVMKQSGATDGLGPRPAGPLPSATSSGGAPDSAVASCGVSDSHDAITSPSHTPHDARPPVTGQSAPGDGPEGPEGESDEGEDVKKEEVEEFLEEESRVVVGEGEHGPPPLEGSTTPSSSGVLTRCDAALEAITDEQLEELFVEIPHPLSTLRKERWVFKLYDKFCARVRAPASLPCEPKIVRGFLRFLGIYAHYALSGIEHIVVPVLRRLHLQAGGMREPLCSMMNAVIKELKHCPSVKKEGEGKAPLCSFDLVELVNRIPDNLASKAQEVSLFLFAHHTGSRAITCAAIEIRDLKSLEVVDGSLSCLEVEQRVTKGNVNWNHPVTVEGYLDKPHPLDVIFWLNRYMCERFGKDLPRVVEEVSKGQCGFSNERLWMLSKDAMRERLKKRLIQAGFPGGRWAFHSFRSGFICSALFKAGADSGKRNSVLETTGVVAGWKVYGRSQRRYIKTVAEKMIVSSRLLGLGIGVEGNDEVGIVRTPQSSEEFHSFKFNPPCFDVRVYLRAVHSIFEAEFLKNQEDVVGARRHARNCFYSVLVKWGKKEKKGTYASYYEYKQAGQRLLERRLLEKGEDADAIAGEMLTVVRELGLNPSRIPELRPCNRVAVNDNTLNRETITGSSGKDSLKRHRWTEEEDAIIIKARKEGRPMSGIIDRRISDAYDRLKVLKRKGVISKEYVKPRKAKPIPEKSEHPESGGSDSVRDDLRLGLAKGAEEVPPKPPILAKTGKLPTVDIEQTTSESESESQEESKQESSSSGLEDIKLFEVKHKRIIKEFASLF